MCKPNTNITLIVQWLPETIWALVLQCPPLHLSEAGYPSLPQEHPISGKVGYLMRNAPGSSSPDAAPARECLVTDMAAFLDAMRFLSVSIYISVLPRWPSAPP